MMLVAKKKARGTKTKVSKDEDDDVRELPLCAGSESDMDEDYKVSDLSKIPAPKIEFEMPNLSRNTTKVKGMKATSTVLTAQLLNCEIVKMRHLVRQAARQLTQKFIRQQKLFSSRMGKRDNKKLAKKLAKIEEELAILKGVVSDPDDISKFALLNTKSKEQLLSKSDIAAAERCMYHMIFEKPIVNAVQKFRNTYSEWEVNTSYLLQRLGAQYSGQKKDKSTKTMEVTTSGLRAEKQENASSANQEDCQESDEDQPESSQSSDEQDDDCGEDDEECAQESENESDEDENVSDVEMGSGSESEEEDELAAKRRKLILGACGISEDASRPRIAPKPKSVKTKVTHNIVMDSASEPKETETESASSLKPKPEKTKSESKTVLAGVLKNVLKEKVKSSNKKKKLKEMSLPVELNQIRSLRPDTAVVANDEAVVKTINLSSGGLVSTGRRKALPPKSRKVPEEETETKSEDDNNDDVPKSFFLSGSASTPPAPKRKELNLDDDKKDLHNSRHFGEKVDVVKKIDLRPKSKLQMNKSKQAQGSEEKVHPSWAAKMQQRKTQSAKPQGKRIVFTDDDD